MLNEGLDRHDLDYLVLPMVSIDEYDSKIDNRKAIVVGFFVAESQPANDLSGFIEKGRISILDTDVSPAPTEDGYYMVFVEFSRDDKFPAKLLSMIDELNNITNNEEWTFIPYGKSDKQWPLTKDELEKRIILDPSSIKISDKDEDDSDSESSEDSEQKAVESISIFLKNSLFETFEIKDNIILTNYLGHANRLSISAAGYGVPSIPVIIPQIGDQKLRRSTALQEMLGPNYQVDITAEGYLITHGRQYLLVEIID